MIIETKRVAVVTGVTIELSTDEAAHLSVALSDYSRLMLAYGNIHGGHKWPWVGRFLEALDTKRHVREDLPNG